VSTLTEELKDLSDLVNMMMKEREQCNTAGPSSPKRHRTQSPSVESQHYSEYFLEPTDFSDKDLLLEDSTCDADLVAFESGCVWPVAPVSDRSRSVDLLDSILGSADPHDISDIDEAMNLDATIAEIDQSPISKLNDALTVLPKDIQKIVVDKVLSEVQPNPGNLNSSPQFLPSLISLLTTCSLLPLFSASLSSGSLNLDICCQGHESLHHATETFNNER